MNDVLNEMRCDFNKLARSTEDGMKDLVRMIYEIYNNDYYKEWGYSSFAQFSRHCINVEPRTALWCVQVWNTVKECEYAGMEWVADLSWPKLCLLAVFKPEQIAKMNGLRGTYVEASASVADYIFDDSNNEDDFGSASQYIEDELADGAVNADWMCEWIRENSKIVRRFLEEEC